MTAAFIYRPVPGWRIAVALAAAVAVHLAAIALAERDTPAPQPYLPGDDPTEIEIIPGEPELSPPASDEMPPPAPPPPVMTETLIEEKLAPKREVDRVRPRCAPRYVSTSRPRSASRKPPRAGQSVAGIQLRQHLLLQVPAGRLLDRAALRRDCLLLRLTLTTRSRSSRVFDDVLNLRAVCSHLYLLRGRVRVHRGEIRVAVV